MCQVHRQRLRFLNRHALTLIGNEMARVLVVEDEPNIGSIIVFRLEREGREVR